MFIHFSIRLKDMTMASRGIRNAFFTNLLILGFDPKKMEELYKIQFNEWVMLFYVQPC